MEIKKTTCGTLVKDIDDNFLIVRPTGNNKDWSIPKGISDKNETLVQAALRELFEETNLDLKNENYSICGIYPYNKEKKLFVIFIKLNYSLKDFNFVCNSFFNDKGTRLPEIDKFDLVPKNELSEKLSKNFSHFLNDVLNKI